MRSRDIKLKDLKPGDTVVAGTGFTCLAEGPHVVQENEYGLFVSCNEGSHYLAGQEYIDGGGLVGLTREKEDG